MCTAITSKTTVQQTNFKIKNQTVETENSNFD